MAVFELESETAKAVRVALTYHAIGSNTWKVVSGDGMILSATKGTWRDDFEMISPGRSHG